jgi:hypothetical protein
MYVSSTTLPKRKKTKQYFLSKKEVYPKATGGKNIKG